jgi:GT2 family glycosyltransferase
MPAEPIDIVLLTFNRLDYLIETVDALEARTREPYRLTIVDNASGADVRTWLAENRHRFHQIILRPANEHLPAFQHGIEATTSDPYILAEPDLIVPDLEPCWLGRLRGVLDAHPDFGIVGMGLDEGNRPSVLGPEEIDPATVVDGDLVEGNLGMWFQMIRREALVVPYELDAQACEAVRSAGYRVGWTHSLRAWHLGWDDYKRHPGHLASKHPKANKAYSHYREIELIERPPTLAELANAGPIVAQTRAAGVPDAAVLELSWSGPAVAAALSDSVGIEAPEHVELAPGAAGAVALVDPPADRADALLASAFRAAAGVVVALAPISTFGGRFADDLAPDDWTGRELPGPAAVPLALAAAGDGDAALQEHLGYRTLDERDHWLAVFAAGAFGNGARRLWVWERDAPLPMPAAVHLDDALRRQRWQGRRPEVTQPPRRTLATRVRGRLERAILRRRVRAARSSA